MASEKEKKPPQEERLDRLERDLADALERIATLEAAAQSGGLNLAALREEPEGTDRVLRALRDLQLEIYERDVLTHLDLMGDNPKAFKRNMDVERKVREWELDPDRYRILSVTRAQLEQRVGLSAKPLKRRTDYLVARGDVIRWGHRGGRKHDRTVRFALQPRALIRHMRKILAEAVRNYEE